MFQVLIYEESKEDRSLRISQIFDRRVEKSNTSLQNVLEGFCSRSLSAPQKLARQMSL